MEQHIAKTTLHQARESVSVCAIGNDFRTVQNSGQAGTKEPGDDKSRFGQK
jgi:hypothetical protein